MTQLLECIVGLGWGDEGKGKIVDEQAVRARSMFPERRAVVVRFQGGPNAGHSLYTRRDGKLQKFVVHAAPSGLASNSDIAIGPSVAFDPEKFLEEIHAARNNLEYNGRILISGRTGILFSYYRELDSWNESKEGSIGTTKSGIGPFYQDTARRVTRITFHDYVSPSFSDRLLEVLYSKEDELRKKEIVTGSLTDYLNQLVAFHEPLRRELKDYEVVLEDVLREAYLNEGRHIIIEGAQGTMLDVDMGSIPEVTSSHLLAPYAFGSLGLPRRAFKVYGVEKVYPTRVGNGILPTLATDSFQDIAELAGEVGATTGRKRRVGYPDWVLSRRAVQLNDCDGIFLTRADVVQDRELRVGVAYRYKDGESGIVVPTDLADIEEPIYHSETYQWHLWDNQVGLANPLEVDGALRGVRMEYVGGRKQLPDGLLRFIEDHERATGCLVVGVSIGPARGETVMLDKK
jgi:adenylosuccinate synthase